MKKLIPIIILLFIILTPRAFAESSASVKINNNINSSSTSNSKIESRTDVRVETNGNVTEYSSDEPNQKIEVKSVNGQSSIKVDGEDISQSKNETKTKTPTPTVHSEAESNEKIKIENVITEFIREQLNFIKKIFSFLGNFGI